MKNTATLFIVALFFGALLMMFLISFSRDADRMMIADRGHLEHRCWQMRHHNARNDDLIKAADWWDSMLIEAQGALQSGGWRSVFVGREVLGVKPINCGVSR